MELSKLVLGAQGTQALHTIINTQLSKKKRINPSLRKGGLVEAIIKMTKPISPLLAVDLHSDEYLQAVEKHVHL